MTVEPAAWRTGRIPASVHRQAIGRLVCTSPLGRAQAIRRFLENAPQHGIDPSLIWGAYRERPPLVRQCCLAVIGSGRTANLFVAPPENLPQHGDEATRHADRVEAIAAACHELPQIHADVALAQALPDPTEAWAVEACLDAGFTDCGELAYLSRALGEAEPPADLSPVSLVAASQLMAELGEPGWREPLLEALEASYEGTLDCPELCGLRRTEDILESHLAVGEFDADHWWVLYDESGGQRRPGGCMLLSHCPDQRSVELVYVGLAPSMRGRGLGRRLLAHGLERGAAMGAEAMTCAVDTRNAPAMAMYESAGFAPIASRRALVRPLGR